MGEMSTSISLAISANQETLTSRSFSDLRETAQHDNNLKPDTVNQYERRHTGQGSTTAVPAFLELGSSKLRRWRHHPRGFISTESNNAGGDYDNDDFYDEVDERMSRNSNEYPEQQAKYVHQWLSDLHSSRSRSFQDDFMRTPGNVIGIRGFLSDNLIGGENKLRQNSYNRLRSDYRKLQSEHKRLHAHLEESNEKFKKIFKRKSDDLDTLRAIVKKQGKELNNLINGSGRCEKCRRQSHSEKDIETERIKHELRLLELKLEQKNREHKDITECLRNENDQLRSDANERKVEVDNLKNQIKSLSLEPGNRTLLTLFNENMRLKDSSNADMVEYQVLKENYAKLNNRLKSMSEDQKFLEGERSEEVTRMMVELCRYQVYQPKLELTLDTERQIKLELQSNIENMKKVNEHLREELDKVRQELSTQRMRSSAIQTVEIGTLQEGVEKLQEKVDRLVQEKSDLAELLRISKSKVTYLDGRLQSEVSRVRNCCQEELELIKRDSAKLVVERDALQAQLDDSSRKSARYEADKQKLHSELMEVHRKLELANHRPLDDVTLSKLTQAEDRIGSLTEKLGAFEARNRQLNGVNEDLKKKLEHSEQQLNEVKRQFETQQKVFNETNVRKDKELARLRVDLNFEQYNRQVALKGIERELRSSLKELETMKCRNSNRLSVSQSNAIGRGPVNRVQFNGSSQIQSSKIVLAEQHSHPEGQLTLLQQQQQATSTKLISEPLRGGDTS